ncbi:hypothetical protein GQX74_002267 [Glossina fuscipes]|nr:hypothetical protein GQX74_002267 [Glossina fuscipes]
MLKLLILWFISCFVARVWSECILHIPDNKENAPSLEKRIGDRWFKIPHISNRLKLQEGEIIYGYCAAKFKNIGVKVKINCESWDYECQISPLITQIKYVDSRNLTILCVNDLLEYLHEGSALTLLTEGAVECNNIEWTIKVESVQTSEGKTSWCREEHQIFELSTNNLNINRTLAHVCYDLKKFSLQSIKYQTIKRKPDEWKVNRFLPLLINDLPEPKTLSSEVKILNTVPLHIGNEALLLHLNAIRRSNPWLRLVHYEYSNIISSGPFMRYFNQYHELLDILWWKNLRIINWQRFLNALEQHTTNNSYEMYMGTLDEVQVPLWANPQKFEYLEVQNGFVNGTAPRYVWIYLESIVDDNSDLYVFGYNSPYAEFFELSDVKFCPDICDQFYWLENVRSTFGYANFGIIFCCSPSSFIKFAYAQKLPHITTTEMPDETEEESNYSEEIVPTTTENYVSNLILGLP